MATPKRMAAGWLATFAARTADMGEEETFDEGVRSLAALILLEREAAFDAGAAAYRDTKADTGFSEARRRLLEGRR